MFNKGEQVRVTLERLAHIKAADAKLAEIDRAVKKEYNREYMRITMELRRNKSFVTYQLRDRKRFLTLVRENREQHAAFIAARKKYEDKHTAVMLRRNRLASEARQLKARLHALRSK